MADKLTFSQIFMNRKGFFLPAFACNSCYCEAPDKEENRIRTYDRLVKYYKSGVHNFLFYPVCGGMVAVTFYEVNNINGFIEFQKICKFNLNENYHVYNPDKSVTVFFLTDGKMYNDRDLKGGSIKINSRSKINLAGSITAKGEYTGVNAPESIQTIPDALLKYLEVDSFCGGGK